MGEALSLFLVCEHTWCPSEVSVPKGMRHGGVRGLWSLRDRWMWWDAHSWSAAAEDVSPWGGAGWGLRKSCPVCEEGAGVRGALPWGGRWASGEFWGQHHQAVQVVLWTVSGTGCLIRKKKDTRPSCKWKKPDVCMPWSSLGTVATPVSPGRATQLGTSDAGGFWSGENSQTEVVREWTRAGAVLGLVLTDKELVGRVSLGASVETVA